MSEKRKEDWIYITTPEGKKMIASPNYIKNLLGLDESGIFNRLERLERKIERLEAPQRQEEIISLLREHGKHNGFWLNNRLDYLWKDLEDLVKNGVIRRTRSGTQIMYEVSNPTGA